MSSSGKSGARDRRGAKAREEMRAKGYLQTWKLAQKLTAELGKKVTVKALQSHHERGRIQGELHKASNTWFVPADTNLPAKLTTGRRGPRATTGTKGTNPKQGRGREEVKSGKSPKQVQEGDNPASLGHWANWQAPGFVRMAGRRYQVWGTPSLGWFGASCELP